jgi:UDP-GlcNAc:undecaprenyl-phosphate/decaprenyl-phosphate GlcNAc-1-phosphate transferase
MIYLVIFFTSLVLTIFFTPYLIEFFTKVKIVDFPGEKRRMNDKIIPRMGGLIIYLIVMIFTISFYGDLNELRFFVIASVLIAALGMTDDIIGVSWQNKFITQFLMSFFLIYFLAPGFSSISIFGFTIPFPLNYVVLVFFIVGVINSINLLDGLDGLVSGLSLMVIFVAFLFGLHTGNKFILIISTSMMGALIGFLKFNAYPARIFLGDTGSYSLGFFIITASLISATNVRTQNMDLTFPVILLAIPIIDTIKVMFVRFLQKRNIFLPDTSHIHHIIFGKIIRHKVTVFIIEGFALLFAALSIYYMRGDKTTAIILFALLSVPLLFMNKLLEMLKEPGVPSYLGRLYNKIPQVFAGIFIKFFLPVISIISFAILVGLVPVRTSFDELFIIFSILFIILLLVYSFLSYHKNKYLNDILVFFNLLMFLFYSSFSETISNVFKINAFNYINTNTVFILLLLPSVVFFLFFREKILSKKVPFFSGIDLIILVFVVLLSVSSNLLPNKQFAGANLILFHSFMLYIFYKVIVTTKTRYKPALYYLSFAIPILSLIGLLII